jgi:hypothetical protein
MLCRHRAMGNVIDYTNYQDSQCEWARALTAMARRAEKDKARELAETAGQALKRAMALHTDALRRNPFPKGKSGPKL